MNPLKTRTGRLGDSAVSSIVALAALLLLAVAPSASADQVIGSVGSAAGQYKDIGGIALDREAGRIYVNDTGNNRIDVFKTDGSFLFAFGWNVNFSSPEEKLQTCTAITGCKQGTGGSGVGQIGTLGNGGIAVDNDPASPSKGSIYVLEVSGGPQNNSRVQKFDAAGNFLLMFGAGVNKGPGNPGGVCTAADVSSGDKCGAGTRGDGPGEFGDPVSVRGVAVGPGGVVYVGDNIRVDPSFANRVQKFDPDGGFVEEIAPLASKNATKPARVTAVAVDQEAQIYLGRTLSAGKYDPEGSLVTGWGSGGEVEGFDFGGGLDLDLARTLTFAASQKLWQYDASGTLTRVLFPEFVSEKARGVAVSANGEEIFLARDNLLSQLSLPDPGPLLVPGTTKATGVTGVKATLQTTFNPEGKPSTAHFEYLDKASFEAEGGFKGPNLQVTPESTPTPGGFENQTASSTNVCTVPTEATCLKPETDYVFRAIAKNEDGEVTGGKAEFTTKGPHEVGDLWTTEVGTDSARLHAEVNALGVAGTARFEYIPAGPDYDEHGFQNATATPTFDIGSAETTVARSTQLSGLEPGTAYHYRLVVEDPYFAPVSSAEAAFATFALPGAGETGCPNQAFRTGQGANLPDCRGYELVSPLDKANGDILTRINATGYPTDLEQSSIDGTRFGFSSYRAFGDPASAPYTNQYTATRTAGGWSSEKLDPPRSGRPYRDNFENEFRAFSADLSQAWMLQEGDPTLDPCAPAGVASLYRRSAASGAFEALSCAPVGQVAKDAFPATLKVEYMPELQGTSADGSRALIRISDALTPEASTALVGKRPINQLYESIGGGQIRLVSVLPGGQASDLESSAGTALSEDTTSNQNRFNSLVQRDLRRRHPGLLEHRPRQWADLPAPQLRPGPEQHQRRQMHPADPGLHGRGLGDRQRWRRLLPGGRPAGHRGALQLPRRPAGGQPLPLRGGDRDLGADRRRGAGEHPRRLGGPLARLLRLHRGFRPGPVRRGHPRAAQRLPGRGGEHPLRRHPLEPGHHGPLLRRRELLRHPQRDHPDRPHRPGRPRRPEPRLHVEQPGAGRAELRL